MDQRDPIIASQDGTPRQGGRQRLAWHALGLLLAAALAWLVIAAYRQPDFILEFAGMRLC